MYYANFILRGRLLAYSLGLLFTPVIMHFFSPEAYGSVAVVIMAGTILASTSTLALEKASLITTDAVKSEFLRQLSAVSALFFITSAAIVFFVLSLLSNNIYSQSETFYHFLLSTLLEAVACIAISQRVFDNQIQRVASADVWQMLVTSIGRIFSGYQGYTGAITLFVWYAIGMVFKVLYLQNYRNAKKDSVSNIWIRRNTFKTLLIDYSDFPKYNVPTGLMNQLGTYLPLLTFGAAFGPVVAGYYAVGRRFLKAPGNILTSTIRPVLVRQLSNRLPDQNLFNNYLIMTSVLFLILGVLSLSAFAVFNNFFLSKFLRADWADIVLLLNLLSPLVVVPFVTLPVGAAVVAYRCQKPNLRIQTVVTILRNLVLIAACLAGLSWQESAFIFAFLSLLFSSFGSYWVYRSYIIKKT